MPLSCRSNTAHICSQTATHVQQNRAAPLCPDNVPHISACVALSPYPQKHQPQGQSRCHSREWMSLLNDSEWWTSTTLRKTLELLNLQPMLLRLGGIKQEWSDHRLTAISACPALSHQVSSLPLWRQVEPTAKVVLRLAFLQVRRYYLDVAAIGICISSSSTFG